MAVGSSMYYLCFVSWRFILPLTLLAAAVLRISGISFVYLCLLLAVPLITSPKTSYATSGFSSFNVIVVVSSFLAIAAQAIFQLFLVIDAGKHSFAYHFLNCTEEPQEQILRLIGLQRLNFVDAANVVRLVMPDVVLFVVAVATEIVSRRSSPNWRSSSSRDSDDAVALAAARPSVSRQRQPMMRQHSSGAVAVHVATALVQLLTVTLVGLCGVLVPSVTSAPYLVIFLSIATWWSAERQFYPRSYAAVKVALAVYMAFHMLLLYVCQVEVVAGALASTDFYTRLFGVAPLVRTDCSAVWTLTFVNHVWTYFANPAVLLVTYFLLATQSRHYFEMRTAAAASAQSLVEDIHAAYDTFGVTRTRGGSVRQDNLGRETAGVERRHDASEGEQLCVTSPLSPDSTSDASARHRITLIALLMYLTKGSYLLMFVSMMAWSVLYHSWTALALLLFACFVWVLPRSRHVALHSSPLIVFYAIVLIVVEYVSAINYSDNAPGGGLFFNYTTGWESAGVNKEELPAVCLMIKIVLTSVYWLTLRQFVNERRMRHQAIGTFGYTFNVTDHDTEMTGCVGEQQSGFGSDGYDSKSMRELGKWLSEIVGRVWICLFSILFLVMSIQEAYIYRVFYMILFLFYVITFQVSFTYWKVILKGFLWVVAAYSIIVLISVYTLSFNNILQMFLNATGISSSYMQDIGFDVDIIEDAGQLLRRLLVPTVFLIAIMLQLHMFYDTFLQSISTAGDRGTASPVRTGSPEDTAQPSRLRVSSSATNSDGSSRQEGCWIGFKNFVMKGFKRLWPHLRNFLYTCLIFINCHMPKIVTFTVAYLTLNKPSAPNFVLLLIVCVLMHSSKATKLMCCLCQFWVGLIILSKMTFKLKTVRQQLFMNNCTNNGSFPFNGSHTVDSAAWFGLDKTAILPDYLSDEIGLILALTAYAIVRTFLELHFANSEVARPPPNQVFADISMEAASGSLRKFIQFMLNYGFQMFGLEVSFATSVIVVSVRQDGVALLYACILGVMLILAAHSRLACARVWPVYLVVLAVLLPAQYLSAIGLPPALCFEYPWNVSSALETWLFLPNYISPPDAKLMLGDFFQLLMVSLQMRVFAIELRARRSASVSEEGSSGDCSVFGDSEMHDFIDSRRNFVDVLKTVVFVYWFLVTLVIMFITGTSNINLFCFGYIASSFYFLWYGDGFLQRTKSTRLRRWHLAMGYNFVVILLKLAMQLLGCAFPSYLLLANEPKKAVVQLFSVLCLKSPDLASSSEELHVPVSAASFSWDVVCFVALLIQRRVFMSHYFDLVVVEIKTQNKLASSGARLINQLLASRRKKRKEEEAKSLAALEKKVERIQMRQERLQQPSMAELDEHYLVIRSGGAYMFENDSDDDEMTSTTDGNTVTAEDQSSENSDYSMGADPLTLVAIAMNQGVKSSLATAAEQKGHPRRCSMLIPVAHSPANTSHDHNAAEGETCGSGGASSSGDDSASLGGENSSDNRVIAPDVPPNDLGVDVPYSEGSWETTKNVARLSKTVCESLADYAIVKLQTISKDYRIVWKQLESDRKRVKGTLKRTTQHPAALFTAPSAIVLEVGRDYEGSGDHQQLLSDQPATLTIPESPTADMEPASPTRLEEEVAADDAKVLAEDEEGALERSSRFYRLLSVFCVAVIARTEFLCYFVMIVNHLCSGTVLSMPLPLAALLWGQLSVPRPAKTFWLSVLTYVMILILLKYLFQFGFYPWSDNPGIDVFYPPKIIGVARMPDYAAYDIAVLVCLFLHRSVLQTYGLWKSARELESDLAKTRSIRSQRNAGNSLPRNGEASLMESFNSQHGDNAGSGNHSSSIADEMAASGCTEKKLPAIEEEVPPLLPSILARFSAWVDGVIGRDHSASMDVYPFMFFCDFVNFFIVVFFYWSFGPSSGNVANYLKENRIPVPFLVLLLVQFVLIVIDRALYLRKNAFGKFIFQVFLIVAVHLWLFFILPYLTQVSFINNKPAQVWYFVKCIYFWLSAYQIRSGYPMYDTAGSFFKKHNYLSWTLMAGARGVPFLLELRIAMDWIWTESSLALGHWFTMEDVYANVFSMKCLRNMEKKYPTPRGQNRRPASKYLWGGFVLFGLAFVVWFPLLLFSFANAVYLPNPPVECTFTLSIGGYQPLFTAVAQGDDSLTGISQEDYTSLASAFRLSKDASSFLENYDYRDVRLIRLRGNSTALWAISPPNRESLGADVCSNGTLSVTAHVALTRTATDGLATRISKGEFSTDLDAGDPVRDGLCEKLTGVSSHSVLIPQLFPRYLTVPAGGTPYSSPLNSRIIEGKPRDQSLLPYSNVSLNLYSTANNVSWWWSVQENTSYTSALGGVSVLELPAKLQDVQLVIFSNRIAPASFSFLTGYGVIGLYVSIVFVIGRFLRIFTSGQSRTIMFDELPNVDKILKLCNNIYFARQLKKFRLEEELFAKLLYLYRSPDVLYRWTKAKVA